MKKKKLNQMWMFKFNSGRLKDYNYNIKITLDEARINNELISVAQSEVIRSLFRVTNREFNEEELNELINQKNKIKRKNKSDKSYIEFEIIQNKINKILLIKEIISIKFENKSHYSKIMKDGLFINGNEYVRLLASAGSIRQNTVTFCKKDIRDELCMLLENDRDQSLEIVPAKFNAYFALANSSTIEVTTPRICVVRDCFITTKRKVDYIIEGGENKNTIEENKETDIELNSFDGQGLISPDFARIWAEDMGLDYIPASFIIRAPFLKGMVCTFSFHDFAKNIAKKNFVKDIYGDEINVDDIDVFISESQFKLWNGYKNTQDYLEKCKKNGLGFGVSRMSPEIDRSHVTSNYQFLQILDLDDEQVMSICKNTEEWLSDISGGDYQKMILYFMGKLADQRFDIRNFSGLDNVVKALMLNEDVAKDKYIRERFFRSINKKIRESYLGKLIFEGNYSFLIADPYAQAQHIFGMKVKGLLPDGWHYSKFWNDRKIKSVVACRPPLTFQSELNILNFKSGEIHKQWFEYINSGIIIPAGGIGIDTVLFADADHDGDIIATFNSKEMADGKRDGLPVLYSKNIAQKRRVNSLDDKILSNTDLDGFNCKVGYITNVASSLYCRLDNPDNTKKQNKEILNRIKRCRKFQGDSIDSGKGIKTEKFPEEFVKFQDNSKKDKNIEFSNSIVINKRPYYFKYLYKDYANKYKRNFKNYNIHSIIKFGVEFSDLLSKNSKELSDEQKEFVDNYYEHSFFMFYPSTMNKVCNNMENAVKEIRINYKNTGFDYSILMDNWASFDEKEIDIMRNLYKQYKKYKSEIGRNNNNKNRAYEGMNHFISHISNIAFKKISTDVGLLASLAVLVCYEKSPNASSRFVWECFGDGVIKNLYSNKEDKKINIPYKVFDGRVEYLWKRYDFIEKEIYEENLF